MSRPRPTTPREFLHAVAISDHQARLVRSEEIFEAVGGRRRAFGWRTGSDLRSIAQLKIDNSKNYPSHLRLGTCNQLLDCLDEDFGLSIARAFDYSRASDWNSGNRHGLKFLAEHFFGTEGFADCPGLIWLLPIYVSTTHGMKLWSIRPVDRVKDEPSVPTPQGAFNRIEMPFGTSKRNVLIVNSDEIRFAHPDPNAADAKLTMVFRSRMGVLRNGNPLPSCDERNLGLASCDDYGLVRESYFPAHRNLRRNVVRSRAQFIEFHVIILARMFPAKTGAVSIRTCDVHQAVISLDPESAQVVDINTVVRPYELFIQHYVGLNQLIAHTIGASIP